MSAPIVRTRVLGLDYGLKRIGVSLSDESKILASSYLTLETGSRSEETIARIQALIASIEKEKRCKVSAIVVGLPLKMNGQAGWLADEVSHFIALLKSQLSIEVVAWDERLTSVQAERSLMESHMRRKKRSQVVDRVAAVIILQSYLDSKGM
jgi:putative Holliday junction resolvase